MKREIIIKLPQKKGGGGEAFRITQLLQILKQR